LLLVVLDCQVVDDDLTGRVGLIALVGVGLGVGADADLPLPAVAARLDDGLLGAVVEDDDLAVGGHDAQVVDGAELVVRVEDGLFVAVGVVRGEGLVFQPDLEDVVVAVVDLSGDDLGFRWGTSVIAWRTSRVWVPVVFDQEACSVPVISRSSERGYSEFSVVTQPVFPRKITPFPSSVSRKYGLL
jgi:hypothetical protein